ncbi:SDR family NAD(P)-dependent oxidoreductase [Brevibacterium aurantiacum]|uniref:Oxidoreductase n=1 Tax=Brevibacterium aurantiacum TaxID=273384 RepID=A0A2A3Z205_BREAU|nr:SDR family NAD(P)-dependent oxidoreductase [Brevibacterium aurantiacum]PCC45513.1 oxidoreductase [Brevibacterium aurantiacum]
MDDATATIVITGGSRGMGASHAISLAEAGWNICIADITNGNEVCSQLHKLGYNASFYELDVTNSSSWNDLANVLLEDKQRIYGLVNNAGVSFRKGIMETGDSDWNRVIDVNLSGTFYGMRAIAPLIRDSGGGSIVNISSISGQIGYHAGAYAASKWGVRGLTKTAAAEFASWGIRVNSIHPGLIETPMVDGADAFVSSSIESIPAARAGSPKEVSHGVEFLMSSASSYMTASEITIDGGLTGGGTYWRINHEADARSNGGDL